MENRPFCYHERRLPTLRLNCIYCWLPYILASKREQRDDICSNLAKGYSNLIRDVQCYKFTKLYCGNCSWKIQFWKCNKQNPKLEDNFTCVLRIHSLLEARTQKAPGPQSQENGAPMLPEPDRPTPVSLVPGVLNPASLTLLLSSSTPWLYASSPTLSDRVAPELQLWSLRMTWKAWLKCTSSLDRFPLIHSLSVRPRTSALCQVLPSHQLLLWSGPFKKNRQQFCHCSYKSALDVVFTW